MNSENTYCFILAPKNSRITKDEIKLKDCYTSREDAKEKLTSVFKSLPILNELLELALVEGEKTMLKKYNDSKLDCSRYELVEYLVGIKEICANRRNVM